MFLKKNTTLCLSILVSIIVCSLISCTGPSLSSTWRNEHISPEEHEKAEKTTNVVFRSFRNKDKNALYGVYSTDISDGVKKKIDTIFKYARLNKDENNYSTLSEFYIRKGSSLNPCQAISAGLGSNDFIYSFSCSGKKIYAYFFTATDTAIQNKLLFVCLYTKEADEWKIADLNIMLYSHNGMTVPEIYLKAKKLYSDGKFIPSMLNMLYVEKMVSDGNFGFHFKIERDMQNLNNVINEKIRNAKVINPQFAGVDTSTRLMNVSYWNYFGNPIPMVIYKTNINTDDTVLLSKENGAIHNAILGSLPYVNLFADSIMYIATNDPSFHKMHNFIKKFDK